MISILLASYNGVSYIAEQLDSILCQTCQDFMLYIQDDRSDDGTWEIVQSYAERHPDHITASRNGSNSGAAKHNFFEMMLKHRDEYVMFCDQDDVWLPDKIEKTLHVMQKAERQSGRQMPILVHTDLTVVDKNLKILDRSYRHIVNGNWKRTELCHELAQNTVTGCTAMYNRALGDLIVKEPPFCVMHDWWLALTASAFGRIIPIDETTVLYRQHEDNSVGAKPVRSLFYLLHRLLDIDGYRKEHREAFLQSECFYLIYREHLTAPQRELTAGYGRLLSQNWLYRRIFEVKNRTVKYGVIKKTAGFLFG